MFKKKKWPYLIFGLLMIILILVLFFTSKDNSLKNEIKNSSWDFQTSDGNTGEIIFHENTADFTNFDGKQLSGHYKINSFSKIITISTKTNNIIIEVASMSDNYSSLSVAMKGFKGAEENISSLMTKKK